MAVECFKIIIGDFPVRGSDLERPGARPEQLKIEGSGPQGKMVPAR